MKGVLPMAHRSRPSRLFIVFIAAMCLLIALGVFLLIYGSLHNVLPTPRLPGGGLFARVTHHA